MIAPADEAFRHEIAYDSERWAERCWHLVNLGGGWVLGAGRALWPNAGRRTAVAGLNTGRVQLARRAAAPHGVDDDPDEPRVGPVRIEPGEPLREVRLTLDDPELGLAFDLTFRGRSPAVPADRNRIERRGEVVTDYVSFFQSGLYSGCVRADGEERRVERRAGFRDRGWGLRKHEGAARRGLHVFCGCELPDEALYVLLYETAAGERVFTNGWLLGPRGVADTVVAVEHDLRFEGRRLLDGTLRIELSSGRGRVLDVSVEGRLWMEALGYTAVPGRADPGAERLDARDVAAWDGLFDNACRFTCDGVEGHGYVETGLGVHARYRPEPA